ncbi:MAG: AAA family ATPase [Candidatus Marinimicrobia bacterium]|nr:AAA family ATPase [Candidatus Neomarinimicrobiota bacterium]
MKRSISLSLKAWKTDPERKPLLLRGARQVGKTYVLKEFGAAEFAHCHYVNFEEDSRLERLFEIDLNPQRILNELQLYIERKIDFEKDLLIFDEIQRCPKALTSLKYFCEKIPQLAICSAGSLLGVSLNRDSFPVGKVTFLDLHPMSFEEFLIGLEKDQLVDLLRDYGFSTPLLEIAHEKLWELWKQYLIVGGLPAAVETFRINMTNLYEAYSKVRQIQKNLLDSYLSDIAKHSGKMNALQIERLWRNVPLQLSQTLDGSANKFQFKDAVPGHRGYERLSSPIAWLEKANLIIRNSIIERAEKPLMGYAQENRFKLYFFDVGLLNAMTNISPNTILNYDFGNYKGYIVENFIAEELKSAGLKDLFCWEGRTAEIEFVVEANEKVFPVEVKSGNVTQSKSLNVFEERHHPERSFILSARNTERSGTRIYVPVYLAGYLIKKLLSAEK